MITLDGTLGITTPAETVTGNTILGDATTDTLNVGNGGLVKDASGNVGIGTASPVNFGANTHSLTLDGTGLYNGVAWRSNGTTVALGYTNSTAGFILGTEGAIPLSLATNGTNQASITAAGLLQFNSGYGSVATAYGCRAWVNFNGTGTVAIRASGNVSSITDGGVGIYTVNFTTAIVDANYAVASLVTPYIAGNDYRYFTFVKTQTTSAVSMQCNSLINGVATVDAELVAIAIFR